MCVNVNRVTRGRRGVRIEVFTVILMVIEAGDSIGAGILAVLEALLRIGQKMEISGYLTLG